ncbi:hypothetical protein [Lactococcus formosensis]
MMNVINTVVPKAQAGETIVLKDVAFSFARWLISMALASMGVMIFVFILQISTGGVNLFNQHGGTVNESIINSLIPKIDFPKDPLSFLGEIFGMLTNPGALLSKAVTGLIMYVFCLVAQLIAVTSVYIIIYIRFFQLYLLAFLSPIPMASIASKEYESIGITYIKTGFAYAFQTIVILAVMRLFSFFAKPTFDVSGSLSSISGLSGWGDALGSLVYAIAYIVVIWQTLSISKKLFGVGV